MKFHGFTCFFQVKKTCLLAFEASFVGFVGDQNGRYDPKDLQTFGYAVAPAVLQAADMS